MLDEADEIEETVRRIMQTDTPWAELCLEAQRTTDTWYFWSSAFHAAVESSNFVLIHQIMTEQLKHHEDFSAQPEYMRGHALALEHFGQTEEALRAIRSAIQDDPHDDELWGIERRLRNKLR